MEPSKVVLAKNLAKVLAIVLAFHLASGASGAAAASCRCGVERKKQSARYFCFFGIFGIFFGFPVALKRRVARWYICIQKS
jgi:hypothetical protein